MTRPASYRPLHAPRTVATEDDVARMWALKDLGYTWLMIAQALGLSSYAILQARRRGELQTQEETP